jgi:tRNA(adenine34) deaminase
VDQPLIDALLADKSHPLHADYMGRALAEARRAFDADEVPIGAVIVHRHRGLIAGAHNEREARTDPTAHAEMIAIRRAARALQSWRLEDCLLYVTLEPCPMCAGAIVQARIPFVFFGCTDAKAGACQTLYRITSDERLNHRCRVLGGIMGEECAGILRRFFQERREEGKK